MNTFNISSYVLALLEILLSLFFLVHAGSPLQYTVGKTPIGGTHKVEFGGAGAERGAIGIKSKFVGLILVAHTSAVLKGIVSESISTALNVLW